MRKRNSRDVEDDIRNLKSQIAELKRENKEIREELGEIKNELGKNQPEEKIKVSETRKKEDGSIQHYPTHPAIKQVIKKLQTRGAMTTDAVEEELVDAGYERSRPTVIKIMKRMARRYDDIALGKPTKGVRRSYALRYTG